MNMCQPSKQLKGEGSKNWYILKLILEHLASVLLIGPNFIDGGGTKNVLVIGYQKFHKIIVFLLSK